MYNIFKTFYEISFLQKMFDEVVRNMYTQMHDTILNALVSGVAVAFAFNVFFRLEYIYCIFSVLLLETN